MSTANLTYLTTSNTFSNWVDITNQLIDRANTFYSGSTHKVGGSLILDSTAGSLWIQNPTASLNVAGGATVSGITYSSDFGFIGGSRLSSILQISANSSSTQKNTAINFVNTASVTVSVTSGTSGNANVAFSIVPSAAQGTTGAKGAQGSQGTQGKVGTQGAQGIQGTGTQGIQGSSGLEGNQGATGAQGASGGGGGGSQGIQGTIGSQGSQGTSNQGAQGTAGNVGYTQALDIIGWTKLPNGFILQWGVVGPGIEVNTVNFPTTFPNRCSSVTCSTIRSAHGSWGVNHVSNVTTSGCKIILDPVSSGGYWMALGY